VAVSTVAEVIDDKEIREEDVLEVFEMVAERWDRPDSGLRLEKVADGWRCVTPPALDPYLRSFHGIAARQRLSQAALEVLAIVARGQFHSRRQLGKRGSNPSRPQAAPHGGTKKGRRKTIPLPHLA
jgi:chromosome segregation and condensation protein ScpB